MLIYDAIEVSKLKKEETLGIADVPVEAIKENMNVILAEVGEIFNAAIEKLGKGKLEYIDLTLNIALDGSVGIFGSGVSAEAKGGISARIKF